MAQEISRHFVTIDGRWGLRQVHYRRAGHGPAVLLLHQSPQSSREMVDLMRRWALHFTVIAPDTPGYGQSDALGPVVVPVADFAAALLEFADALGLRRFGVYGYHTGSSIGLWLASAHPERVSALAVNGLSSLTTDERRIMLDAYLPPVVPQWDGSHLAWLWARVREQTIFFPWYERSAATRMDLDVPPADRLHAGLMDFLRAGDSYASAYHAAFASRPETVLPDLRVPLLVTTTRSDPLRCHLERLGPLPALAAASVSDNTVAALERCLEHLLSRRGDDAPAPVATRPIPGRLWHTMLHTADGQVHVRLNLEGSTEPLLLLHDAGGSGETACLLAAQLVAHQPLIIPDLPGHGESDPPQLPHGPSIADCARAALGALHAVGISQAIISGQGAGAWVALETAHRGLFRRRRLMLLDPPFLDEQLRATIRASGLPAIEPQWHGGHLLMAWHMLRDARLFFPWFERTRSGARRVEPDLEPGRLHLELRELLKAEGAWQNLWRAALDYAPAGALRGIEQGLLAAAPTSAWHAAARDAASVNPALGCVSLPRDPALWLPALLQVWERADHDAAEGQ